MFMSETWGFGSHQKRRVPSGLITSNRQVPLFILLCDMLSSLSLTHTHTHTYRVNSNLNVSTVRPTPALQLDTALRGCANNRYPSL